MDIIKKDLASSSFKNIYLLYGEETYLVDYYAKKIVEANTDADTKDFNLMKVSGKIPEESETDSFAESYPFMSEKKVLYIRGSAMFKSANDAQKKYWCSFFENIPDYLIVVFAETDINKNSVIYKRLGKDARICEFKYNKPGALASWITNILKSEKRYISPPDAAYIAQICGPSMLNIRSELDKLISSVADNETVTSDIIDSVVSKNTENRVFAMIDDIADGKNTKALEKLADLKALNEEPIKIISIIFGRYSTYKKLYISKGKSTREICSFTKIYDRYLPNYQRQLKKIPEKKVDEIMRLCRDMDFGVKSGKYDKWLAVEIIIEAAMSR